jgi:hypothetical protein
LTHGKKGGYFRSFWIFVGRDPTEGMAHVGADAGRDVAFVAFVVGLVLEKDELVSFVIGTVVGEVGHRIKLIDQLCLNI